MMFYYHLCIVQPLLLLRNTLIDRDYALRLIKCTVIVYRLFDFVPIVLISNHTLVSAS